MLALVILFSALFVPSAYAQSAVGYGSAAVVYTGPVCHAHDQPSLVACVGNPNPALVVFDVPVLNINSPPGGRHAAVQIGSNKTLQGPVTLESQGTTLQIRDSSNVVISGIKFRSTLKTTSPNNCSLLANPSVFPTISPFQVSQCGIAIDIIGNSKNIWIDHNDFSFCGEKCIEVFTYKDGLDQNGKYYVPDLITISYNRFTNSYFGAAVSLDNNISPSSPNYPPPGRYEHVTFYGNYFQIFRRAPRLSHVARVHEFNNVIVDWGGSQSCVANSMGFGPSPETDGQLIAENNAFVAWPNPTGCKQALLSDGGFYKVSGSLLLNGAILPANRVPSNMFSVPYAYPLLTAIDAYNQVPTQAGN